MYRMGTGDCFILKFYEGRKLNFTMMIDGGVWQGSKKYLNQFATKIAEYCDNSLDLLVITHEHRDHVLLFDRCKEVFKKFKIKELWLGWTEEEGNAKVEKWQKKYGEKKKALALAAEKLQKHVKSPEIIASLEGNKDKDIMLNSRSNFANALMEFSDLHVDGTDDPKVYKGSLRGMKVIKEELQIDTIKYLKQGQILRGLNNLPGINFYVLGPPNLYDEVKKEKGKEGESYNHNKDLETSELLSIALRYDKNTPLMDEEFPFDRSYCFRDTNNSLDPIYNDPDNAWRKIDHDWLFSAGNLALRMNSLTNNLSLALAIEFDQSKKVMLFPGDAEYGSWESWHNIEWPITGKDKKHLTEDLLNRTIFYKVAHHLSHNGTAKAKGLEMMNSEDLTAMATVDYNVISKGWKNTMPNRAIVEDLLERTKGRLIIMNEEDIFFDRNDNVSLTDVINKAQRHMNGQELNAFKKNFIKPKAVEILNRHEQKVKYQMYYDYKVDGT